MKKENTAKQEIIDKIFNYVDKEIITIRQLKQMYYLICSKYYKITI